MQTTKSPPYEQYTSSEKAGSAEIDLSKAIISPQGEFLWVEQGKNPQDRDVFRAKQSFIRTQFHRRRRDSKLQALRKSRRPFSASHGERQPLQLGHGVYPSLQLGVIETALAVSGGAAHDMNQYFHHFRLFFHEAYLPVFPEKPMWLMQAALRQPALLQTILGMSASHRAQRLLISDSRHGTNSQAQVARKLMQNGLTLRWKGLVSLQLALARNTDLDWEGVLMTIAHLILIEVEEKNADAVNAHMNGLMRIINMLGGLDNRDPKLQTLIYKYVCVQSATLARDGTFLFTSPWSGTLHPDLKLIIRYFQAGVTKFEPLLTLRNPGGLVPVPVSVSDQCDYIILIGHRLLSLSFKRQDSFQHIIRLTLQAYISTRMQSPRGGSRSEYTILELQRSLETSPIVLQSMAPDLLFWVCFVRCLGAAKTEVYAWFLERLAQLKRMLGLDDWESAVRVLHGFLFVARYPATEQGRVVWERLLARSW
ncbi:uncharacterized protein BDV14DRAFT_196765 [Aspergillus stella-maris]|uniref:uncharacterized protein n=1 Tax=Aspergillus stella-maris TaxID=1810926 RepID=UPI003CCC962F